jgi:hypothetical protein
MSFYYNTIGGFGGGQTFASSAFPQVRNQFAFPTVDTTKIQGIIDNAKNNDKQKSGVGLSVLELFLKYGPNFVSAFKGNKSYESAYSDVTTGNVSQTQLDEYLKKYPTGDPSAPRTANLFGIPTSTLILCVLVVIAYFTFKKDSQPAYRRR